MTKIKLCGLSRPCDIEVANELRPEYIGFVFAGKSKRYVTPEKAKELKKLLVPEIQAVGVFVNENPETVACLLNSGVIDIAQLHGSEDENYIKTDLASIVEVVRQNTNIPCGIGFGISTPEQAKKMANISDGAIVGSAIIKLIEKYGKDSPRYIGEYVKSMKSAL